MHHETISKHLGKKYAVGGSVKNIAMRITGSKNDYNENHSWNSITDKDIRKVSNNIRRVNNDTIEILAKSSSVLKVARPVECYNHEESIKLESIKTQTIETNKNKKELKKVKERNYSC